MNYTENYNLNKPEKSEQYNVKHWTDNMDTIDTALQANADAITTGVSNLTQGLSAETNARMNGVADAKDLSNAVGILAPAHGGTGQNSLINSINALLAVSSEAETLSNADRVIFERIVEGQISTINSPLSRLADKIFSMIQDRISEASIPIGIIYPFAGEFGTTEEPYKFVPSGFLACDGHEENRIQRARLFGVIGTKYGNGDEINTFNVPDLRECALVGAGENTHDTIATHDTYTLGQFKDDQIQNITGTAYNTDWGSPNIVGKGAFFGKKLRGGDSYNYTKLNSLPELDDTWDFDASRVARAGDVTRGKRKAVNFIIKY